MAVSFGLLRVWGQSSCSRWAIGGAFNTTAVTEAAAQGYGANMLVIALPAADHKTGMHPTGHLNTRLYSDVRRGSAHVRRAPCCNAQDSCHETGTGSTKPVSGSSRPCTGVISRLRTIFSTRLI